MEAGVIQIGELKMPFSYKIFGEKPATGRSLYISMHGGGGAPKRVNDGQWENQKKLYQLDEGVYVAPRAPTDTWDLWHQSHIDPMFDRLIENMVLFEDVDPDRVYLMGYSAGGDGVYQIAPRMADRFAAASMMAGHPNETSALGLRNLPFAIHMGANDAAYNRNQTATQWQEKLAELHQSDPEGYVHVVKLHEGKGHWMDRQDAEALPWMHQFTRNRFPKSIVWKQDDVTEERLYWLAVNKQELPDRALVRATADGQVLRIEHCDPSALQVLLRDDWIDMSQEIEVRQGDSILARQLVPRTIATIDQSLRQRGDPKGIYWGRLSVAIPSKPAPSP
jgi:predicted esterase